MKKNFKVITLCGSTKFKDDFLKIQTSLTLKGVIVISLGLFSKVDENLIITNELEQVLIAMHKQRIDMADGIFVINKNGYIGFNTKMEIEYAKLSGKTIEYLEPIENFSIIRAKFQKAESP